MRNNIIVDYAIWHQCKCTNLTCAFLVLISYVSAFIALVSTRLYSCQSVKINLDFNFNCSIDDDK